nr:glycoside hydrolase family 18 [uncultured Bacteroides sp.]
MKKIKNKLVLAVSCFVLALLYSCSNWTDLENIEVKTPNITNQNPELYAKYLQNLVAYKNDPDHKIVYAWFDNSEKKPFNRAQHITELPDSIDFIALMYPDSLADFEKEEIQKVRKEKNTKVIYSINYESIKQVFEDRVIKQTPDSDFISFMVDTLQHALNIADEYQYDGISIAYKGKSVQYMTDAEKRLYIANEKVFIGMISTWYSRHQEKILVFEGKPENMVDKSILEKCKNILLPVNAVTNESLFNYTLEMSMADGVPVDRFGIIATTTSLDTSDKKTGYLADGKTLLLPASAEWVISAHSSFKISGFGIYNTNNDYYNPGMVYKYTRNAISTINPSIK